MQLAESITVWRAICQRTWAGEEKREGTYNSVQETLADAPSKLFSWPKFSGYRDVGIPPSLFLSLPFPPSPSLSPRGSASPIRGIKSGWCHAKFNKLISILPVCFLVNSPYSSGSL